MNRILNKGKLYCHSNSAAIKREIFSIHITRYKSYYTSLGLDPNASQKDIKSAYYELSLKYHPDKTDGCPEATEKFREVTEAYKVLGNPDKKRAYDENIRLRGPYYNDFQNDAFARRSYQHKTTPRTGKSKYYNYDEHYKQHYEEYMKRREAENEYFRRRWEADRRSYYGDNYSWEDNYRTRRRPPINLLSLFQSKAFVYLTTFWVFMFIFSTFIDDVQNGEPKVIYYNVDKDNNKTIYYNVKKDEKNDDSEDE